MPAIGDSLKDAADVDFGIGSNDIMGTDEIAILFCTLQQQKIPLGRKDSFKAKVPSMR